mgnify:CR=1 FL=1
MVFLATGLKPNSSFVDKKLLNEKGFVKVNEYLQLKNKKNIFVAGDVNDVKEEKTAQAAKKQARFAINNIKSLENNQKYC